MNSSKIENKITTAGLDHIIGHLQKRLAGFQFKELSIDDFGLKSDYSLYQVQSVAEQIALHMSLLGYTPVINLCDLPEHVAGSINLNDQMLVYINLDKKRFENHTYQPAQLLTIIVHELCHKFLWVHGFKETSFKIEYITDACAVYVGFGEIILKGCEVKRQNFDGLYTRTEITKLGYLDPWQISYLRNKFFGVPIPREKGGTCFYIMFAMLLAYIMVILLVLSLVSA